MQQIHKAPLSEFAIASLTLGIMSFIHLGGIEKAILAIVLGVLALKRIAAVGSNARGEGLAAAGIVLGVLYAIIAGVGIFILAKNPQLLEQILQRPLPR